MPSSISPLPSDTLSPRNMHIVTAALTIILLRSTQVFGLEVLAMTATSFAFALLVEMTFCRFRSKKLDTSWMVTPLVFTLLLPPRTPLWMVAVGAAFGVFFGKAVFGGMGRNVFNPAVVGRLFLTFAFPQYMLTRWFSPAVADFVTTATPLITLNRRDPFPYSVNDLIWGNTAGTLGETFRLGILVLGLILIALRIVDWRIPTSFIGTVFALNLVGGLLAPDRFRDPVLSILVGGLFFAAFFVATDPVTAPLNPWSKLFYGIGLGVITVVIRNFGAHNEGIIFAIIIMNALAPLLDSMSSKQVLKEGVL